MGKQRKKHETPDSRLSNNRNEDKNYSAIYLIKGRFWAEIKHYKNRRYINKNCSSNFSEETSFF